jgi:phage-related tail protein
MAVEKYAYGIASVKFGTPTGSSTMPASGNMTTWSQTVAGSFTLSEDEAQEKLDKMSSL